MDRDIHQRCLVKIKRDSIEDQNLEAWRISWFPMPADAADIRSMVSKRKPTPLFVYAYKNEVGLDIPVTGDYDLAAIVPSRVAWKLDGTHTADEDAHGASIISPYGQFLVKELNARCNQTVFRHGAETQNLHFAQPLDAELICITSGGGAYVVQKEKMAEASFDMVCRQYMPKWNPVYARDDLPLGGKLFGLIPQHLKENFSAHYQGLAGLVGRLRSLHREHFSHELPFEARSQQEMHARESKNFHEVHYQLVSDLKKALHACLQSVEIDNNEEMNVSKASDLCDQITDIIFYSERYNAYINFAEKSNASPDFLFFNEGCFKSTSISGAFMMQTPARKAWADTARNISENIGNPKFLPISPDAIKTNRSLRKSLNTERKRLLNTLNMSRQSLSF